MPTYSSVKFMCRTQNIKKSYKHLSDKEGPARGLVTSSIFGENRTKVGEYGGFSAKPPNWPSRQEFPKHPTPETFLESLRWIFYIV